MHRPSLRHALLALSCALLAVVNTSATQAQVSTLGPGSPARGDDIRGRVRDAQSGRAVGGAHIIVVGGSAGTYADDSGRFVLRAAPSGTVTLRAIRLGYTLTEQSVANGAVADIMMKPLASQLSDVVTQAGRTEGYRGVRSSTGLKLDADLMDVPISVQLVPRELLDDRGAQRIEDAIETVSGVRVFEGFPFSNGFQVRGVADSYTNLRNGRRDGAGNADIATIERVEILKGPNSVTLGANIGGGGVVNTITKKPQAAPGGSVEVVGGRFDYYRLNLDATGPVAGNDHVLYRLVAAGEDAGSPSEFAKNRVGVLSPSMTVQFTDNDQIFANYEYEKNRFQWPGAFPVDKFFLAQPYSRNFSGPALSQTTFDIQRPSAQYTHRFSPDWRIEAGGSGALYDIDIGEGRLYNQNYNPVSGKLYRQVSRGPQRVRNGNASIDLVGSFNTGSISHQVDFGGEYFNDSYFYFNELASLDSINAVMPVFSPTQQLSAFKFAFSGKSGAHSQAGSIQDLITIVPQFKLLLGGRVDYLHQYSDSYTDAGARASYSPDPQDKHRFSPRIGVVLAPSKATSFYANYINSFIPNLGTFNYSGTGPSTVVNGNPFPPTVSKQFEAGVKQEVLDGRVTGTLAVFNIDRTNVYTVDAAGNYVPTGRQRSRGVEVDAAGQLTPMLRVVANYAYTDATITEDQVIPLGSKSGNVPPNAGGIWMEFSNMQQGQGFGLGAGARYTSATPARLPYDGNDTGVFDLPRSVVLDAAGSYSMRNYRLGVNLKNITNTRTFIGDGAYSFAPGRPFDVVVSLSRRF